MSPLKKYTNHLEKPTEYQKMESTVDTVHMLVILALVLVAFFVV